MPSRIHLSGLLLVFMLPLFAPQCDDNTPATGTNCDGGGACVTPRMAATWDPVEQHATLTFSASMVGFSSGWEKINVYLEKCSNRSYTGCSQKWGPDYHVCDPAGAFRGAVTGTCSYPTVTISCEPGFYLLTATGEDDSGRYVQAIERIDTTTGLPTGPNVHQRCTDPLYQNGTQAIEECTGPVNTGTKPQPITSITYCYDPPTHCTIEVPEPQVIPEVPPAVRAAAP